MSCRKFATTGIYLAISVGACFFGFRPQDRMSRLLLKQLVNPLLQL